MIDRRRFLASSVASVTGALLAACNTDPKIAHPLLALAERKNEVVERAIFRHRSMDDVAANARLSGMAFPQYYVADELPIWDPAARGAWRLKVSGAVRRPLSLSMDDLLAMPRRTQLVDHFCVEGWNARAKWTGVRLSDIARAADLTPDAGYVDFQSFDDGYHESWDIDSALHPQTLVDVPALVVAVVE